MSGWMKPTLTYIERKLKPSKGTHHDPKHHHPSNMVEAVSWMDVYGCQWNCVTGFYG